MNKAVCLMFVFAALMFGPAITNAQTADAPAAASASASQVNAVDANFVAQANLGAPFQIDTGRLAEKKGTTAGIRDYAHLMVVSHIPVVNALNAILQRKNITAPPNTLLRGAYDAMVASLQAERGTAFATMSMGKLNIRKETPRSSNTRSRTGPTRTSRNSRGKPCRRSKIIYSEHSPWQKAAIARPLGEVSMRAPRTVLSSYKASSTAGIVVTSQIRDRRCVLKERD
jgi:predicted outer membrane protein